VLGGFLFQSHQNPSGKSAVSPPGKPDSRLSAVSASPEPVPPELLARPAREEVVLVRRVRPLVVKEEDVLLEQWLTRVDPAYWEKLADPDEVETNGYRFALKSAWIPGLSRLPHTTLRMRYDPATERYALLGAELEFGSGFGISYEEDPDDEETRGYLRFNKSF
jgi:hypothetical protein